MKKNHKRRNRSKPRVAFQPFLIASKEEKADLVQHLKSVGTEKAAAFPGLLKSLQQEIRKCSPVTLLGIISSYGSTTAVEKSGRFRPINKEMQQFHIEFLQALTLRFAATEFNFVPPDPVTVQKIWDDTIEVCKAFAQRRLVNIGTLSDRTEQLREYIREKVRANTQCVRNWGYHDRVVDIVVDVMRPLEKEIQEKIGVQIGPLFRLIYNHIMEVDKGYNQFFKKMRKVLTSPSVTELLRSYYEEFPSIGNDPQEAISHFTSNKIGLEEAKTIVMSHMSLSLSDFFIFSAEDFADGTLSRDEFPFLRAALDSLSFSFGDLCDLEPESLFLKNPCWNHPFVKLEENTYFLPIVTLPLSFPFEIVERLLSNYTDLLDAYYIRRGKFLEERVAALFRESFVDAKVYRGNLWIDPVTSEQFENDVLVVVDCFAIVIEAKAGRVTAPAKRGALPRLKRTVQELIQSSAEQSQRFADFITSSRKVVTFDSRYGRQNTVDLSKVTRVTRLSVLLDDLATLQSTAVELQKAGLIAGGVTLPSTMTLADLEIVVDVLESPAKFLHYLIRREEFEHNTGMIGDELDMLGFYLDTGFNIGEIEFNGSNLVLTNCSAAIDDYYTLERHRANRSKPSLKLTSWWQDIVSKLEERAIPSWLQLAVRILNVSFEDQRSIEKQFWKVKKNVKNGWRSTRHLNALSVCIGPVERRNGFVFLAYRSSDIEWRHDWISEAAAALIENSGVSEVLGIACNVDKDQYPYSSIGLWA